MIAHQRTVFTANAKGYALHPLGYGLRDGLGQGAQLARPWLKPHVVLCHPYCSLVQCSELCPGFVVGRSSWGQLPGKEGRGESWQAPAGRGVSCWGVTLWQLPLSQCRCTHRDFFTHAFKHRSGPWSPLALMCQGTTQRPLPRMC